MYAQTFDVIDLINLVAGEHDWDLSFDSGPGDTRELIFSRTNRFDIDLEVEIVLDFTGRIECSQYRRDGELFHRNAVDKLTSAADVHVLTFDLFKRYEPWVPTAPVAPRCNDARYATADRNNDELRNTD